VIAEALERRKLYQKKVLLVKPVLKTRNAA
jgi:hypothetical protein